MTLSSLAAVAVGGALGATARYLSYALLGQYAAMYATLAVNVSGSFLMGVLIESSGLLWSMSRDTRLFLAVGILGSFTTFSTFSLDVILLYSRGKLLLCALYIVSSTILSIGALAVGMQLIRWLTR